MPISPENKARYPSNWKEISAFIRFERAGCQRCHLRYDADHHAKSRRKRKEKEHARVLQVAGQMAFSLECKTGKRIAR